MRVKSSLINISVGLGNQLIITILSFISRTVFINTLGIEYLGINGLLTNILAMLSLAEAGIGSSIMYSLYKPVAENDQNKINVLMKLYKKAYMIIALVILLLGLSIMPFLDFFVKGSNVENIHLIYLIFLLNTVAPYFYIHKNSFLNVCQKGYLVTGIYSISSIISVCIKIGILQFTRNYILYLIIDSIITIINSIIISIIANRKYPFLRNKTSDKLDNETTISIIKNIKAIVLQNIGTYLVFGTDNIIISSFVSVAAVGLYSNYNMLIEICRTFINQVFNNIYHSVGNLVAKETKDRVYNLYKVYRFLNFWLYSFLTIVLAILLEPFISLWLGPKFLMSHSVLAILVICFYERGMRNSITTIKTTAGIFYEDRYAPLFQAGINLVFSIVLVKYMGISGVFLGTLISALAVPFWTTPYFVYKKVFKEPLIKYFINYTYYVVVGLAAFIVTRMICSFIPSNNLLYIGLSGLVCLIVPNIIYITIFYKTEEFRYLLVIMKKVFGSLQIKMNLNKKIRNAG
ncbi:lipopolysaccharide biosynthesis protein [Neobacillus sp. KR4-4]|uniref:lipopolysaccharide biosynthesis protein n=1 Tax=Neobacillus sp. KR4-4 TaxID=3344872 RepID=UPI0035CC3772